MTLPSAAFAEKYDYVNKNYNASNIKSIVLLCTIPKNNIQLVEDTYAPSKFNDLIINNFTRKNIKVTLFSDLLNQINTENNVDIAKLEQTDHDKAMELITSYLQKYDACLTVNLLQYNVTNTYISPTTYTTTQYQQSTVYNTNGTITAVDIPQTVTNEIPGMMGKSGNAKIRLILIDTHTNETIFDRKELGSELGEHPFDVAKRIVNNYVNNVIDMIKK